MQTHHITLEELSANITYTVFASHDENPQELNAIIQVSPSGDNFGGQLWRIREAVDALRTRHAAFQPVFARWFLSDIDNQVADLRSAAEAMFSCAQSFVQQPPLNASKASLWLYMVSGMHVNHENGMTCASTGAIQHLWAGSCVSSQDGSYAQTEAILHQYGASLTAFNASIATNCIRTWFFVRDIDRRYQGLVKARRAHFEQIGLTPSTHFIASTGIGGTPCEKDADVSMDAYALAGDVKPEQIRYLKGASHLNPTAEYGVTFERATCVSFRDRRHVWVSGTASINNKGEVVHPGDVVQQTHRLLENISVLLAEAHCNLDDAAYMHVYLRDTGDAQRVRAILRQRFPQLPIQLLLAPVCRPEWLIEAECMAVKAQEEPSLPAF